MELISVVIVVASVLSSTRSSSVTDFIIVSIYRLESIDNFFLQININGQ